MITTSKRLAVFALPIAGAMLIANTGQEARGPSATSVTNTAEAVDTREVPPKTKKFCLKTRLAGTDDTRKVCKTFENWMNLGIDPRGK